MKFRPCIDIHNGAVKQIVGGSLKDTNSYAKENFVASEDGAFFANLYKNYDLKGGHIILLNKAGTKEYEASLHQAKLALEAYPGGFQIGGGMNPDNAYHFLELGASHVIVTSYVFKDGVFDEQALDRMLAAVGKEHLVIDLSSRKRDGQYYITTDRWQKFTDVILSNETINDISNKCSELLVHAVDVEGKASGIEMDLVKILANSPIPSTYAGGVHNFEDLDVLRSLGNNKVDVTIGSSLDIFGGKLKFEEVISYCK